MSDVSFAEMRSKFASQTAGSGIGAKQQIVLKFWNGQIANNSVQPTIKVYRLKQMACETIGSEPWTLKLPPESINLHLQGDATFLNDSQALADCDGFKPNAVFLVTRKSASIQHPVTLQKSSEVRGRHQELLTPMTDASNIIQSNVSFSNNFTSPTMNIAMDTSMASTGLNSRFRTEFTPASITSPGFDNYGDVSASKNQTPLFDATGTSFSGIASGSKNISFSLRNKNHIEEFYEAKLHPEESLFKDVLQQFLIPTGNSDDSGGLNMVGNSLSDYLTQAEVANTYASYAEARRLAVTEESRRLLEEIAMGSSASSTLNEKVKLFQLEAIEFRIERDLWSLLDLLTKGELLNDIDEHLADKNLDSLLHSEIDHKATGIPEVINAAFQVDKRLKKGAILKEWLELSVADEVVEIPVPQDYPWGNTLNALLDEVPGTRFSSQMENRLNSVHPDAQLTSDALLLPLVGDDAYDQELILQYIWQLLRSGQLKRAQEVAVDHHLYWLAGSIGGLQDYYYESLIVDAQNDKNGEMSFVNDLENGGSVEVTVRRGNAKKSQWMQTCWKYAEKLSQNPHNFISQSQALRNRAKGALVGSFETTIYAALSNHSRILLSSSLVTTWSDKLWALVKCIHERDILLVVHKHRLIKANFSDFFPDCDDDNLNAEARLLENVDLEIGHLSLGSFDEVFNKLAPPTGQSVEASLLRLQASIIRGKSALAEYIDCDLYPFLKQIDGKNKYGNVARLLRIYCHLLIWLKFSSLDSSNLSDLVSDDLLTLGVKCYVNHLIITKQRAVVAPYLCFLSRSTRISKYAEILISLAISSDCLTLEETSPILQLAQAYFSSDLQVIVDTVVEIAKSPHSDIYLPHGVLNKSRDFLHKYGADSYSVPQYHTQNSLTLTSSKRISSLRKSVGFLIGNGDAGEVESGAYVDDVQGDSNQETPLLTTPYPRRSFQYFSAGGTEDDNFEEDNGERTPLSSAGDYSMSKRLQWSQSSAKKFRPTPSRKQKLAHPSPSSQRAAFVVNSFLDTDHLSSLAAINWQKEFVDFNSSFVNTVAVVGGQLKGQSERLRLVNLIGSEDVNRLNCMRWKWLIPTNPPATLDAIRQTNRFLNTIYLESQGKKILHVKLLFHKFIPPVTISCSQADSEMQRKVNSLQEFLNSSSGDPVGGESSSPPTRIGGAPIYQEQEVTERVDIAREGAKTELTVLLFWESYIATLETVAAFHQQVSEYQSVRNRLVGGEEVIRSSVGRYALAIDKLAGAAISSIQDCLQCKLLSSSTGSVSCGGVTEVWQQLQMYSFKFIYHKIRITELDLKSHFVTSAAESSESLSESTALLRLNHDNLLSALDRMSKDSSVGILDDLTANSNISSSYLPDDVKSTASLARFVKTSLGALINSVSGNYEATCQLLDLVAVCNSAIVDVMQANHLASHIANGLLSQYSQICSTASRTMEAVFADKELIQKWNKHGIMLANIIASNNTATQFYNVLRRDDLKVLLHQINAAALRSMSWDATFAVGDIATDD